MDSKVAFPEPWLDLRGGSPGKGKQRESLRLELAKELSAGHDLYGRAFSVVARSNTSDDVLVVLDDGTAWALVHLTWKGSRERPPWPMTVFFTALDEVVRAMRE